MKGHLDGLTGWYLVGWAMNGPQACEIVARNEAGDVVASGIAADHRPDLAATNEGRTNLGFRLLLPPAIGGTAVQVFADGVELRNSPLTLGPGLFDGSCVIAEGAVTGWVTERMVRFVAPLIEVFDDGGRRVARAQSAGGSVTDPFFTPANYRAELDPTCFGAGEMRLTVRANGVKFLVTTCNLRLLGNIEQLTPTLCSGWVFSPDAPRRSFEIELRCEGRPPATAACTLARKDVAAKFPDVGACGFNLALPAIAGRPDDFTTCSLHLPGSNAHILNSPFIIGSRLAAIEGARQAARMAHQDALPLTAGARAVLTRALADFLAVQRPSEHFMAARQPGPPEAPPACRFSVIIPVYRDVAATRRCIDSVMAWRDGQCERVVLIDDCAPDADMAPLLKSYAAQPHVSVLTNGRNLGFVQSVNRGLAFCTDGDVILLNSDTRVFAGGLAELWAVAQADPGIGTVTALSDNATIFSYPHPTLVARGLDDATPETLAAAALAANRGTAVDVPTGHGFCLLITRPLLQRLGRLDEGFGRGYGEENDFCARAADLGYRNAAAAGAFVEHTESVSFGAEKAALLAINQARLDRLYPEYTASIMEFERRDPLRAVRWPLDTGRLRAARARGQSFALVVTHKTLGGGTARAVADLENYVGYGGATRLSLVCRNDGALELSAASPSMLAVFMPGECEALFAMLRVADPTLVLVHQLLGFPAECIAALIAFLPGRRSLFYAHDYYALCPRVTLIDAAGRFCDVAATAVCDRCISLGGAHEASRLGSLDTAGHRALFATALGAFSHVVTPSDSAAGYLRRVFAAAAITGIAHPAAPAARPSAMRQGRAPEIVLLGAIGPHKGSALLLELARLARLRHPDLRFRVIGHTDIDPALQALGVIVTGAYTPSELTGLCAQAEASFALFLSVWPETYTYTLSEAVQQGFTPIVLDIGAPAERLRAAGFGHVLPFPPDPPAILAALTAILGQGPAASAPEDAARALDAAGADASARTRAIMGLAAHPAEAAVA